jgi:hypothetical protein
LLFIIFIAEKPASHKYDVEKGTSVSIAFFVMMGYSHQRYNQNEAICFDERFSSNLLSYPISISSSSSATVNSTDWYTFNTDPSLTQF